jgi:isopenicillin N synthase-like dioxygenase
MSREADRLTGADPKAAALYSAHAHGDAYEQAVRCVRRQALPVLDLAGIEAADAATLKARADELAGYVADLGFLAIVNHGVPRATIAGMQERAAAFFERPVEEKRALAIDRHERGYTGLNVEVFHDLRQGDKPRNDLNEAFNFGREYAEDDPLRIAGRRMYAANRWPAVPGFAEAATRYLADMEACSKRLLPVWATALGLAPDYFAPWFEKPHSYVRVIHYPAKPQLDADDLGIRPHADTSFNTLLPRENEPGLQVMTVKGEWVWPDIPEDSIVVNFGMFLEQVSNGRVRATPHRVIPPTGGPRYSMPLFMCPQLDAPMACLPTCHDAANPPRAAAETFWHFHTAHMAKIYPHFAAKAGEA